MKCPECLFENREEAKFCSECGHKFELICPECGTSIRSAGKFCDGCGYNLEPTLETRPFWSNAEQLSPDVAPIVSERKHVTVLFSDISGYTAISEKLDPEDVREIMSGIFGDIAKVIARYDGFIERFIGDAVMALFGVPKVQENHAIKAIRAAREIHALVEELSSKFEEQIGQPLNMH
ncbi:MAG: adenylate/guanylate cyclase domain-containing protein, partial [Desulfobacterales bacterium]